VSPVAEATVLPARPDSGRVLAWLQTYGVYVSIVVLLMFDAALSEQFLSVSNLRVQLFQVTPVVLVALGMALVIGTEGIDLSVGAVIALASAVIPLYLGYSAAVAIAVALVLGALSGVLSGSMVAFARVQPIVATLSMMIGVRGLAVILNGASAKPVTDPTIDGLGLDQWLGAPKMAWIALVIVLVTWFVVRSATTGRPVNWPDSR